MIIETLSDGHGLELIDPLDKSRFVLRTPQPVSPTEVDADGLDFPVERAVEVRTSTIEMHANRGVFVQDADGVIQFESSKNNDRETLPSDEYVIELAGKPMKIYLSLSGPITFERKGLDSELSFGQERSIVIGVRSKVQKPPGTITITNDIEDIMRAMSLFGSALKETSTERSYPTLRGHPPLVEYGTEFHVPSSVPSKETETTLVLPPEKEYLYPAASLAYYLNSSVVPGSDPRLVAGNFEYELGTGNSYEETIERILRQVFFLDCLVRTDGYYSVDLHERELIEPRLDIDLDGLFDAPLEERLPAYLNVSFDTLEPVIAPWYLAVDMVPTTENARFLPFLANKLAFVRTAYTPSETKQETPELVTEFYREQSSKTAVESDVGSSPPNQIFEMKDDSNTLQRAWIGPGYPLRWNKLTYEGLHAYSTKSHIDGGSSTVETNVTIVCNDESMQDESDVSLYYELRKLPQFNVSIYHRTTKDELVEQLTTETDFFHYIGHISDKGIRCEDGHLDVRELSEVNVTMFLLNACSSYEQGMALIERGSMAGVATLSKVSNTSATEIGQILIRLLSLGYSFQRALSVINRSHLIGYKYVVLGEGNSSLCQSKDLIEQSIEIVAFDGKQFDVELKMYPVDSFDQGSIVETAAEDASRYYLVPGKIMGIHLSGDELEAFFNEQTAPVEINGDLYWSDELTAEKVREQL